ICDCPSAGHDMIFLDYRECGAQGEPKVVHIDQECDYKITHLADCFEEFIRGLVSEDEFELYDDIEPDEESEDAEDDVDSKGIFTGFVLLSEGKWDKQQFIHDMKEKWDIDVTEDEDEKNDD